MNGTSFTWPTVNLTPVIKSTCKTTEPMDGEFDNWFHGVPACSCRASWWQYSAHLMGAGLAQQVMNCCGCFLNKD